MYTFIERFCQILGLSILVLLFAACGGGGGGFNGGDQQQTPTTPAEPLSVTTSSLEDGTVGQAYLQLLEFQGGSSNTVVQWVSQGQLPPGLTLDPSVGKISGTPTTPGIYPFVVQAQDMQNSSLNSAFTQLVITIVAPPSAPALSITTDKLPDGNVGVNYLQLLQATGGGTNPVYKWSIMTGKLPDGLSLSTDSTTNQGLISGTPTTTGSSSFVLQVQDLKDPQLTQASKQFTINIIADPVPQLSITTGSLDNGTVGQDYLTQLQASGGAAGSVLQWTVDSGKFPPGLTLGKSNGSISGVPTAQGSYSFVIKVEDIKGLAQAASKQFTMSIVLGQLTITTTSLPDGTKGQTYPLVKLQASGAASNAVLKWTQDVGKLPDGLTLDEANGVISGTPTKVGNFDVIIKVTDTNLKDVFATKQFRITVKDSNVSSPLSIINTSPLSSGVVGQPYLVQMQVSGASTNAQLEWSSTGTLPDGVNLDTNTGRLSGTPTKAGNFDFIVGVQDKNVSGSFVAKQFRISIQNPPALVIVNPSPLNSGVKGKPYQVVPLQAQANGVLVSNTQLEWSLNGGALPDGLSLDSNKSVISGTPITVGNFNFIIGVQYKNISGSLVTKQFSITVNPALEITTPSPLPNGFISKPYSVKLGISGAASNAVLVWSIDSGKLPNGLQLDPITGVISGTPTATGDFYFFIGIKDTNIPASFITKQFLITVFPQLTIDTKLLQNGTKGQAYSAQLQVSGAAPDDILEWSINGGTLPDGLRLNSLTGLISGTPSAAGNFDFIVKVINRDLPILSDTQQLHLTIIDPDVPVKLGLATTQTSVKSDNSDQATITATVLNGNNIVIPGVTVSFVADGGELSNSSAVTDNSGKATVNFRAGSIDKSNRVNNITASTGNLTQVIPIKVVGTTTAFNVDKTSLASNGSDFATGTVTVKDSGGNVINNSPVCFIKQSTNGGNLSIRNLNDQELTDPCPVTGVIGGISAGTTDLNGIVSVKVRGSSAGNVELLVISSGAQASANFLISDVAQVFKIIQPISSVPPQLINTGYFDFQVSAPGVTTVIFSTSLGIWDNGQPVYEAAVVGGIATARLTSTKSGTANVVAQDKNNSARFDNVQVQFTPNIADAAKLLLDATAKVVPISTGGVQNTSTLVAKLLTATDQPIANAVISFTQLDSTGGGEFISPPFAITNSQGVAQTTFISGSQASNAQGIRIQVQVTKPNNTIITNQQELRIVITGQAGSVTIGRSTIVSSINNDTAYSLPMSAQVTDVNGNPVKNAQVNLSAWPLYYRTGFRVPKIVYITGVFGNEDVNENLVCDGCVPAGSGEDINGDGVLTPSNSTAGNLPLIVTTGDNGLATFNLTYLKEYADWIVDRIRASTVVSGTQIISESIFTLSGSAPDEMADPPVLPSSPFNAVCPYVASAYPLQVLVLPGAFNTVTLTLTAPPPASQAGTNQRINNQPVLALINNSNIKATGGYTDSLGKFISTISATANAQIGNTAIIDYYVSCTEISVHVVVAPLVTRIDNPVDNQTITAGTSLSFEGNAQGISPPYTYAWAFPGGTPSTGGNTLSPDPITFNTPGIYTVKFTAKDSAGNTASSSIQVKVQ